MLKAGQKIAHFIIVKKLGSGGMGEVYLAEDQKLHRQVALKLLTGDYFDDDEKQQRFQREASTAARISHPNVMAIHEIGKATDPESGQEQSFIVMECVEGSPVSEYLQSSGNEVNTVIRLAEKIASGLAAAHKMNVVHRDIKSQNILINEDGEPKILDFGLAKPMPSVQLGDEGGDTDTVSQQLTKVGKILGTVSYMSPEQARGETIDLRSDIFSFGVLLYHMSTGEFPFAGSTNVSTLAKILEVKQESPRLKNASVPQELERIIEKCLQKSPGDRYQDTRDLVVDLRNLRRQYDSGVTDSVSTVSDMYTSAGKAHNLKITAGWKAVAAIVVTVLVVAAALVGLLNRLAGNGGVPALQAGENSLAILAFENKTGDTELDWLETGLPEILLTDLSQTQAITLIGRQRLEDYLYRENQRDVDSYSRTEMLDAARALGAVNLLSGSLYKLGDNIRIDARLEEIGSGKVVLGTKVMGPDAFSLVDSLTHKIAKGLNLSQAAMASVSVSQLTSTSPEAYRLYHEGLEYFNLELYEEAVEKLNSALAIDPGFALAYMRMGIANTFRGRPQEGSQNFALAREHQDRMPVRERRLLDIYCGFWLDQRYDDSFAKLKSYVEDYPDDKEARTIYAIATFQFSFARDTLVAFAHLDTVLLEDPRYQLALSEYAAMHERLDNLDRAIEYVRRILEYHPQSPGPYLRLASLYLEQQKVDDAIEAYEEALSRFPANSTAIFRLGSLYIRKRDFDRSRSYLDQIASHYGDDPFRMRSYYLGLANLANWSGKFRTGIDHSYQALEQAHLTGDSAIIANVLSSIATNYQNLDFSDSALAYARRSHELAAPLNRLNYPIMVSDIDPVLAKDMRPLFDSLLEDFKARMPSELWSLADLVKQMFEAVIRFDTAAIIATSDELCEQQPNGTEAQYREAAILRVLTGDYEDGRDRLLRFLSGRWELTSGFRYPLTLYFLGIASEGLGEDKEAAGYYREMLEYWGDPEIELKEIKDARSRLARLTG
ncbi:MAG: protein kinase [bacterium]